jgi:hypothetical protein
MEQNDGLFRPRDCSLHENAMLRTDILYADDILSEPLAY